MHTKPSLADSACAGAEDVIEAGFVVGVELLHLNGISQTYIYQRIGGAPSTGHIVGFISLRNCCYSISSGAHTHN